MAAWTPTAAHDPLGEGPLIVCLQATGVARERLQTVVEGLALRGCE